jgi:hypothetical protein
MDTLSNGDTFNQGIPCYASLTAQTGHVSRLIRKHKTRLPLMVRHVIVTGLSIPIDRRPEARLFRDNSGFQRTL